LEWTWKKEQGVASSAVWTHKDLHVAAVVDEQDRVLVTSMLCHDRQGYRQMIAWMRSFGEVQRIGIESTGSYGAGLLRFVQQAGIAVLEVTTPDKHDRSGAARTMISMRRTPRTQAFAGNALSRPEAVMEWLNPARFSRLAGRQRLRRGGSPCR
jgi:hypothetical protein